MRSALHQSGLSTVEFAVVALLALIVVFGVIEIGRAFFVFNSLEEATRRGARVAAVCRVNDPAIANITVFAPSAGPGTSPLVYGLTSGNVRVQYLNQTGGAIGDPIASYSQIAYVRVQIVNFQHRLLIPLFMRSFTMPAFMTTLPRESLGVYPTGISTC